MFWEHMVRRVLLLGAAVLTAAGASPVRAADRSAVLRRLDRLQRKIEEQAKEIETLHRALDGGSDTTISADPPSPNPVESRLTQQDQKIDDLVARFTAERDQDRLSAQSRAKPGIANGRPQIASADGRFSAALRVTLQYDTGHYMQSARARMLPATNGPDLSDGSNFRRAQIGLQGALFGDWSYSFKMDFGSGGSTGTESPGRIQEAYVEYDGLAPFLFRIGAHAAAVGLESNGSSSDQLLLERASPAELARGMASGTRSAVELVYAGERLFGSLAYTGDKPGALGAFDEQQAIVARVSYSPINTAERHWVISAGGSDIFRPARNGPHSDAERPLRLSSLAELVLDDNSTKFVDTGEIADATEASNWGVESGASFGPFLAQGGYFGYGVDRRGAGRHGFDGWYGEASWVLTGEGRGWSEERAAFVGPRPRNALSDGGGIGAFEVAARYSALDLNDQAGTMGDSLPVGSLRGGQQRIVTLGLNWYPNTALKFTLQAQNVEASRIGTNIVATPALLNTDLGQNFNTIALRSQIAF